MAYVGPMAETTEQLPPTDNERAQAERLIEAWLDQSVRPLDVVEAIEALPSESRWFVRLTSEEKGVFSVWFRLHQRRVHVEAYVIASPEEQRERVFEYLLRQNASMGRCRLCIAEEDAIFVRTAVDIDGLDEGLLDEVFGEVVEVTEHVFRPILRMGFASRLAGS